MNETTTTISALIINPGEQPRRTRIPDTLQAMQEAVGGYIEAAPIDDPRITCWVNEEGKLDGLAPNRPIMMHGHAIDVIHGPMLIVGNDPETGETIGLDDELATRYEKVFALD